MSIKEEEDFVVEKLMEKRILTLTGRIQTESIGELISQMLFLQAQSNNRIDLIIDSGGGVIQPALKLCDFMSHILTVPVRGIAVGSCSSAATFIMMHCAQRVCTPHAGFVIHSGTHNNISVPMNETTEEHLQHLLATSKKMTELVIKLYMQKLKKTRAEVQQVINRGDQHFDKRLSAKEAVEIGLVEEILKKNLKLF